MFGNAQRCSIIGVVHLGPLPGSAGYEGSIDKLLDQALAEARLYKEHGIDALIVENMHDAPYLRGGVEPETTAAMSVIAAAVKRETSLPTGVQLLAAANNEALGAALAGNLDFIRVEGFVFAHVGDEGIHESCAAGLVRRRAYLKAEHIKIFADIKKKHSAHAITSDVSLEETAKTAEFFKADGVIVTGGFTGDAPPVQEVKVAREAVSCSVLVGSGVTEVNLPDFATYADGLIVGSTFKEGGHWSGPLSSTRLKAFMDKV